MSKQITVIIPCYNVEKYVSKCLDSVLAQNFNEQYDIIVINDGSTDNTMQVLNGYRDKLTKLVDNTNHGVAYSRRLGAELATTKYVVYVDSDDWVEPDYLQTIWDNHTNSVMPFVGMKESFADGSQRVGELFSGKYTFDQALMHFTMTNDACAVIRTIFEREKLLKIEMPELTYAEDFLFILSYAKKFNFDINILPNICYVYNRANEGSATKFYYGTKHLQSYFLIPFVLRDILLLGENTKEQLNFYKQILNKEIGVCTIRTMRTINYKSAKKIFNSEAFKWFRNNKGGCQGEFKFRLAYFMFKHKMLWLLNFIINITTKNKGKVDYTLPNNFFDKYTKM